MPVDGAAPAEICTHSDKRDGPLSDSCQLTLALLPVRSWISNTPAQCEPPPTWLTTWNANITHNSSYRAVPVAQACSREQT